MIQVYILIYELYKGDPVSPEVTNGFFINSWLKIAADVGMVLVCVFFFSRHDALVNMQHYTIGSSCGLELKPIVSTLTFQGQYRYGLTHLGERDTMACESLRELS